MVDKVKELIQANPYLMSQDEQEKAKKSGGQGGSKANKASSKPIADRLDEIEE